MKSIRRNVFETNSSSTHSLCLLKTDRKFTKVGKLIDGGNYSYKPLGPSYDKKKFNATYYSEYDKLCVCFDLLFLDYVNKCWVSKDIPCNLEKYRKDVRDDYLVLLDRYYLSRFVKGNYYREFQMVLKKHNISFELNDSIVQKNKNGKNPVYCDNYDGSGFDFMYHFKHWGFQSIAEAIDEIVFNPNFIIQFERTLSY